MAPFPMDGIDWNSGATGLSPSGVAGRGASLPSMDSLVLFSSETAASHKGEKSVKVSWLRIDFWRPMSLCLYFFEWGPLVPLDIVLLHCASQQLRML